MASKVHSALFLSLILLLGACDKDQDLSPVPAVKGVSIDLLNDNQAEITVSFEDGDGNLGLFDFDTGEPRQFEALVCERMINGTLVIDTAGSTNPYYYNLFITYQEMVDGEWIDPDPCESNLLSRRVPVPEPEGQDKTLIGDIVLNNVQVFLSGETAGGDSIRYGFQLFDRDLNESNVLYSELLVKE